jgi:hypothetical protein
MINIDKDLADAKDGVYSTFRIQDALYNQIKN